MPIPVSRLQQRQQQRVMTPAAATLMETIDERFDIGWNPDRPAAARDLLHSRPTVAVQRSPVQGHIAPVHQSSESPSISGPLHQLQLRGYCTDDPEEIPHSPDSAPGGDAVTTLPRHGDIHEQLRSLPRDQDAAPRIEHSVAELLSLRPVPTIGSTRVPQSPPLSGPSRYFLRSSVPNHPASPPSAQDDAFADIARRAEPPSVTVLPNAASRRQRWDIGLPTTPLAPRPIPLVTVRDFGTQVDTQYLTDNATFMRNVRERLAEFAPPPRNKFHLRFRRVPCTLFPESLIYYDLLVGKSDGFSAIMRFDWRPDECLGHRQGSAWSALMVNVGVVGVLGMDWINAVVFTELWVAVRKGLVTETLAKEIWEEWKGSGDERMAYRMDVGWGEEM